MSAKPLAPALGRAPRPRTDPEALARLVDEGGSAGFARPLTARPEPVSPEPRSAPPAPVDEPEAPLRLEVPKSLWRALKLASVDRGVSVKFLVIEALLAKGYSDLDLATVPEDGRRRHKR